MDGEIPSKMYVGAFQRLPVGGEARRVADLASSNAIRAAAVASAFLAFASEEEGRPLPEGGPPVVVVVVVRGWGVVGLALLDRDTLCVVVDVEGGAKAEADVVMEEGADSVRLSFCPLALVFVLLLLPLLLEPFLAVVVVVVVWLEFT